MKEFWKKYGKWLIIIFVGTLTLSYIVFAPKGIIPSGDVDKNSWLTFWGGFLAFFGSFFLGLVAIWQNEKANGNSAKANELSEKLIKLNEQANAVNEKLFNIETQKHCCNVILGESIQGTSTILLTNENEAYDSGGQYLFFSIANYGEDFLKKIIIKFPTDNVFVSHIVIAKDEHKNIKIERPKEWDFKGKVEICFISCNDVTTYGDFEITDKGSTAKIKYYHFYGLQNEEGTTNG